MSAVFTYKYTYIYIYMYVSALSTGIAMKISKSLSSFFEGYLKLSAVFQIFKMFIYKLHDLLGTPNDVRRNNGW